MGLNILELCANYAQRGGKEHILQTLPRNMSKVDTCGLTLSKMHCDIISFSEMSSITKKLQNNANIEQVSSLENKPILSSIVQTKSIMKGENFKKFDFSKSSEEELYTKVKNILENENSTNTREIIDMVRELEKRRMDIVNMLMSQKRYVQDLPQQQYTLYYKMRLDLELNLLARRKYVIYEKIRENSVQHLNPYEIKDLTTHGKLPQDVRNAFFRYYDSGYILGCLRKGMLTDDVLKSCKLMDEGFELALPLEKEAIVYRGVSAPRIEMGEDDPQVIQFIENLQAGITFEDKAYTSVATDTISSIFNQYAGQAIDTDGVIMKIRLPKGTKCIYSGDEAVLPRNSKFKISNTEYVDGVKVVNCEYVLPT